MLRFATNDRIRLKCVQDWHSLIRGTRAIELPLNQGDGRGIFRHPLLTPYSLIKGDGGGSEVWLKDLSDRIPAAVAFAPAMVVMIGIL